MSELEFLVLGDFPASIHRQDGLGHLCGYLGVPKPHPWYGLDYDQIDADVHGGLTYFGHETVSYRSSESRREFLYSRSLNGWSEEDYKAYAALPRWDSQGTEPFPHDTGLDIWWVGFDCAHSSDLVPGLWLHIGTGGVYRDLDYVRAELEKLASQAAAAYG